MADNIEAVREALQYAQRNPAAARAMLQQPVTELEKLGIKIPQGNDAEAKKHLQAVASPMHQMLTAASSGQLEDFALVTPCMACQFIVGSFAGAVIAAATVAVGGLFVATDGLIVALATALGSRAAAGAIAAAINTLWQGSGMAGMAMMAYVVCAAAHVCP